MCLCVSVVFAGVLCCVVFACVWQAMCVAHVSVEHGRGRWWQVAGVVVVCVCVCVCVLHACVLMWA